MRCTGSVHMRQHLCRGSLRVALGKVLRGRLSCQGLVGAEGVVGALPVAEGRADRGQAVRVLALDVPPAPDEAWARDALARLAFTPTVSPPDRERLANLLNMRAANL